MKESDEKNCVFTDAGPPGSPERSAAIPKFKTDTLDWATRMQKLLNDHADPPRYLTRTLQKYIDGMLLYSENITQIGHQISLRQVRPGTRRPYALWRTSRHLLQVGHSVVAVGTGEVKPNRKFSDFILGGLWPETSPGPWTGAASAQRTFAQTSRAGARDVGVSASAILADNDGAMIEAMHVAYQGDSKAVEAQSDLFTSMAESIDECAGIVKDARLQMDAIDREAHEAIQRLLIVRRRESFGGWVVLSMIWAILAQARTAALAASVAAAANIGSQATRIQSATQPSPGGKAGPPVQAAPYRPDGKRPHLHGRQRVQTSTARRPRRFTCARRSSGRT